jgi:hypothetical protein
MSAGRGLSEAEVELEAVEPGEGWLDTFLSEFGGQIFVMLAQALLMWSIYKRSPGWYRPERAHRLRALQRCLWQGGWRPSEKKGGPAADASGGWRLVPTALSTGSRS